MENNIREIKKQLKELQNTINKNLMSGYYDANQEEEKKDKEMLRELKKQTTINVTNIK